MSGPDSKNKVKRLVQSKLSFISQSDTRKLLGSNQLVVEKGIKRKFDNNMENNLEDKPDKLLKENAASNVKEAASVMEAYKYSTSTSSMNLCNSGSSDTKGKASSALHVPSEQAEDTNHCLSDSQSSTAAESENNNVGDSQFSSAGEETVHKEKEETAGKLDNESQGRYSDLWKGKPLKELKKAPFCLPPDLKFERNESHTICVSFGFQYKEETLPTPFPRNYEDRWDANHVRMPCSEHNEYPSYDKNEQGKLEKRWGLIKTSLARPIHSSFELEEAILQYNQRYMNKWNFNALHHYCQNMTEDEHEEFFEVLLPRVVELALHLPQICPMRIPLLKKDKQKKLTLSQQQIASLLANAFFCTFPRRNSRFHSAEYANYPTINFSNLFQGQPSKKKMGKLQCIIHYFKRVCHKMPAGIVTFSRQVLFHSFDWSNSTDSLKDLHVSSFGTIEDDGIGMLQVDFANKYIGGGVLGHGCVQEEIRFMICPEMIVTRLFTEALGDKESLIMTGCERFSAYEGYADSFQWKEDFTDTTPRDRLGRLCCEVVAIDALVFQNNYSKQFQTASVIRELDKAYCGFKSNAKEVNLPAVCTGNWGCGAFGGDKQLKSLIQLMAASVARRDICYFTFGDEDLTYELFEIYSLLQKRKLTVGAVMRLIASYNREVVSNTFSRPKVTLFTFIHAKLSSTNAERQDSHDGSATDFGHLDIDNDSNEAQYFRNSSENEATDTFK